MSKPLFILILSILCLFGCRNRVICPAFQSTYILDESVRNTYYSYLWKLDKEERLKYLAGLQPAPDTVGAITASVSGGVDYFAYVEPYVIAPEPVRKSKYGIVKYEPYWLKNYQLKTAPMENVLAPPPVEAPVEVDVGEFVASDFTDSVGVDASEVLAASDSTSVLVMEEDTAFVLPTIARAIPPKPKTETKYLYRYDPKDELLNVEQAYYNKYFGNLLTVEVPVRADEPVIGSDTVTSRKKGGLFQRFKSNREEKKDQQIEEVNPSDNEVDSAPPQVEPVESSESNEPLDPSKEADENDGF